MNRHKKITIWLLVLLGTVIVACYVVTLRCLYISVVATGAAHSMHQQLTISMPFSASTTLITTMISYFAKKASMKTTSIVFSVIAGLFLLGTILFLSLLLWGY